MKVYSLTTLFLVACWSILAISAKDSEEHIHHGRVVAKKPPPKRKSNVTVAPRIVGGVRVKPMYKYPSIVSIKIDGDSGCAGTIIDKSWVLSAAHCTEDNPKAFVATAAEYRLNYESGVEQVRKVVKVIVHEKYNPDTIENDIVLFKVDPPFKFTNKVKPAKLPSKDFVPGDWQTVIGWGLTKDGGDSSEFLREVNLPIISDEACKQAYKRLKKKVVPSMLCAMSANGGQDACQGDSGGPFYHIDGAEQTVTGIVSWGIGCAKKGNPGVFTEVSYYLDWINEKMGKGTRSQAKTKKPTKG